MEEMILERDALSIAKENFENFLATHDVQYVAEDALYKNLVPVMNIVAGKPLEACFTTCIM